MDATGSPFPLSFSLSLRYVVNNAIIFRVETVMIEMAKKNLKTKVKRVAMEWFIYVSRCNVKYICGSIKVFTSNHAQYLNEKQGNRR